jgi:hypothetical protein
MSLVTIEHRSPKKEDIGRPHRIQRKRSKGWQIPENTICVDDSTPWGNPFIAREHGTHGGCVRLHSILMSGYIVDSVDNVHTQRASLAYVDRHITTLTGKNLACWCRAGTPCHADFLLELANQSDWDSR